MIYYLDHSPVSPVDTDSVKGKEYIVCFVVGVVAFCESLDLEEELILERGDSETISC